jgi:hypothetical protein
MDDTERFAIGIMVAIFVHLFIIVPPTYFRARRFIKKDTSTQNRPIPFFLAKALSSLSIPL